MWVSSLVFACVASVFVANFDVLAARKLGREQKKKEGEGERRTLTSPTLALFGLAPTFARPEQRNLLRKRLLRRLVECTVFAFRE